MKKREITEILKSKGLRSTKYRKNILSILSKSQKPHTIEEIERIFEKKTSSPHFTTLYRELKTLGENNLIDICGVHGQKEYSLKVNAPVTHCTNCNTTTELSQHEAQNVTVLQGKLKKDVGFQVFPNGHIHGLCNNCIQQS